MSDELKPKKLPVALSDLWRSDGVVDRRVYAFWGVSLCTIKFLLDSFVSNFFFHQPWTLMNYIMPGRALDILALTAGQQFYFATMVAISLPFIWTGVVLTTRRMRAANLPTWLSNLFFIPVVNLMIFGTLCILPTKNDGKHLPAVRDDSIDKRPPHFELSKTADPPPEGEWKDEIAPIKEPSTTTTNDALFSIVTTVPIAGLYTWAGASVLQSYGWGLFIGIPFALGAVSAYLFGRNRRRTLVACIGISCLAITCLGGAIMLFAWEGLICLLMASPLAYTLAIMGACLGYQLQRRKHLSINAIRTLVMFAAVIPFVMGAEYYQPGSAPRIAVQSVLDVDAPIEEVWENVICFPKLAPPEELLFKVGVAYPIGATISGAGPGAVRRCKFSTGTFVEPITKWEKPELLEFGVLSQPEPMKEFALYRDIQPAHLRGYLNIYKGQFELKKLDDGRTRIIGTTWYENRMWPANYWKLWTDYIIHCIHNRVLIHIKNLSERESKI